MSAAPAPKPASPVVPPAVALRDAFDKSNSDRSDLVKDKLKKKKLAIAKFGLTVIPNAKSCAGNSARLGVIDKKTLSKFLVYAEYPLTK